MERRILYTATVPFYVNGNGSLVVQGSTIEDVIHVRSSGKTFLVSINELRDFAISQPVKRVLIEGAGGDDRIAYEGKMRVPVVLLGGNGNDRIEAVGPNVLLGGGRGRDRLYVRGTFGATLAGGVGDDHLVGGDGPDVFDGGDGFDTARIVRPIDSTIDIEESFAVSGGDR